MYIPGISLARHYYNFFFLLLVIISGNILTASRFLIFSFLFVFSITSYGNVSFTSSFHPEAEINKSNVKEFIQKSGFSESAAAYIIALEPNVTLIIEAEPTSVSKAGQEIIYTYIVTNISTDTLTDVSVINNRFVNISLDSTTIKPNGSVTGTESVEITQEQIDAGSEIVNEAEVTTAEGAKNTSNVTVTVNQAPSVSIEKSADIPTVSSAGVSINYSYVITNNGNITLTEVAVSDDMLGQVNLDVTTLKPGESAQGNKSYPVTQNDINSGDDIVNVATVTTAEEVTDSDEVTVTVNRAESVEIVKTADKTSVSSAGEIITYKYEVTNKGNATLNDITVTDDKLGQIELDETSLEPGEKAEGTGTYTVTQSDIDSGDPIVNLASVNTAAGASDEDEVTVIIDQQSGLTIEKTASQATFSTVGQEIEFTITVTNNGNVTLNNITVSDPLVQLNQTIGSLAPGVSRTFSGNYKVTQENIDAGSITNIATASNGSSINVSDTITITATQNPGITITKTASPATYSSVGDVITYTLVVQNTGNVILSDVMVTDQLLGLEEQIGDLAAGESAAIEESYTITQIDLNNGSLVNNAFVTGNDPGGNEFTHSDEVRVTASQNPNLAVRKSASPLTYDSVGDRITYTIEVENTGNVALLSVIVSDELIGLSEIIPILGSGETRTYTGSLTVIQQHLNLGSITNTVTVTGIGSGSLTVNDTDEATVTAVQGPELSVSKTVEQETFTAVGDEINYSILVQNTGNITITSINVDDPLVQLNETIGTLNPGQSRSLSAVYVVKQPDLDRGTVINRVEVTGRHGSEFVEAEDEAIVTALSPPVANDDHSADHLTGEAVVIYILGNDLLNDGSQALPGLVTVDLNLDRDGIQSELVIPNEGLWSYDSQSGELTFTPQPGFTTDPSPIIYLLTEKSTGLSNSATVTVDYNEGVPFAFNDISTGNTPGEPVTVNILANDKLSDGSPVSVELVTIDLDAGQSGIQSEYSIPGEGNWIYNPQTGEVVFTPLSGFTTDPTPVIYILTEILTGLSDEGTIIISYNEQSPVAEDDISTGNVPGDEITINILENDKLGDGTEALPELVSIDLDLNRPGVQDELNREGEGRWSLNSSTGDVTFFPLPGFSGSTHPVTYRLMEILTGLSDTATITIVYNDEAPVAVDDTSSGNQAGTEVSINILNNDLLSDGTQALPDLVTVDLDPQEEGKQHELVIDGQGTWTYNEVSGVLIFTPLAGFFDDPTPISYILCGIWNPSSCSEAEVTVNYEQESSEASIEFVKTGIYNFTAETIEYLFEVTNTGNIPVWNINIADEPIGEENLRISPDTLNPGQAGSVTAVYQITLSDKNLGSVTNSAVAVGLIPDGTVSDSSSVVVQIDQCEMVIPNGFSPNDDGIQDTWRITCLDRYPNARVEIFNRWGNRVFEKRNFGNTDVHGIADAWWDGYSTNRATFGSSKLPAGTYYYILYLQEGQEPLNGFIFLNR